MLFLVNWSHFQPWSLSFWYKNCHNFVKFCRIGPSSKTLKRKHYCSCCSEFLKKLGHFRVPANNCWGHYILQDRIGWLRLNSIGGVSISNVVAHFLHCSCNKTFNTKNSYNNIFHSDIALFPLSKMHNSWGSFARALSVALSYLCITPPPMVVHCEKRGLKIYISADLV